MYEAYAAMLVGVVCGAAAIAALNLSRNLAPLSYTAMHLATIVVMITLVTLGYDSIPVAERYPQAGTSRLLYVVVSWLLFIGTMAVYRHLQSPSAASPKVVKS
jgi:hypothetical protein